MPSLSDRRGLAKLCTLHLIFNNVFDNAWLLALFRMYVPYYCARPLPPMYVDWRLLSPINNIFKFYKYVKVFGIPKRAFLSSAMPRVYFLDR